MEYVTRGVCGQEGCRERRYYLDNGLWFCGRGHLQEGRQVEEDPDDFGTRGERHWVKKNKEERSRKTYRGRQAATLFLQAYQLILWKQTHALVHDHGFPEQFEAVVRDLWALRLQTYSLRIDESADDEDDEFELFSSQATEAEGSDDLGFKPSSTYLQWPRLLDSVALCYLAAILMRTPVCVNDFHRLVIRQDIPYIRAIRSIPRDMRDKLPPELVAILDISEIPKPEQLHRGFIDLAIYYQRRFAVAIPPLNSPIILYRHIKRLAIPIDVYETIKTLQGILGFKFDFPPKDDSGKSREALDLPEVQIAVLLVISTKLLFPFDDLKRYPATYGEPSTQVMDWPRWLWAQKRFTYHPQARGELDKEMAIQLTDRDVFHMDTQDLDQYMDWYETHWLDKPRRLNPVADMFPTTRTKPASQPETETPIGTTASDPEEALRALLRSVMESLKPAPVSSAPKADIVRPGSWYRRYRRESQLPEAARVFYEINADLASVSLSTLIRTVSNAEWRIAKWLEDQRRAQYMEQEMQWNTEDEDDDEDEDEVNELDELDEQLSNLEVGDGTPV